MKIIISAALALFCASVVYGEASPPITESNLKCGDQVYHRCRRAINVFNACTEGKDRNNLSYSDIICQYHKLDLIKNGEFDVDKAKEILKRDFTQHHEALSKELCECFKARKGGATPETTQACILNAYEKVCGHKTLDWFNTVD
ncbi:unnamed protein product [Allacma fusca]|uniref:Uncharacterized protein n=1 Tax=Allacma fusca TaxID=39272 RepID=A0A8J2NNA2_9HEXA|nr:unnamed protein product [Allacma fusca]